MRAPKAKVCLATAVCRVLNNHGGTIGSIRLHWVLYVDMQSEMQGSWLQSVLQDRLIDCSMGSKSENGLPAFVAQPFAPGQQVIGKDQAEMFFMVLPPDMFTQRDKQNVPVPLKSCADMLHPPDVGSMYGFELLYDNVPRVATGHSVPTTLEAAFNASSPRAAIVLHASYIPDIGSENLKGMRNWFHQRGVVAARRVLVLHYRAGRLPADWHHIRLRSSLSEHLRGANGRQGLPHEAFWNNFWVMLHKSAVMQHVQGLCLAQRRANEAACSASRGLTRCRRSAQRAVCNASAVLGSWCAAERGARVRHVPSNITQPILLLGGDAHYAREMVVYRLWQDGVLEHALWSFATPPQCSERGRREVHHELPQMLRGAAAKAWQPFCRVFAKGPKRLDLDLSGPLEASSKDVSFPPEELYTQTRFSLVFESVVGAPGDDPDYPPFLTEKVLKPIFLGHPFMLMCHVPGTTDILRNFGFRLFGPTMGEGPFDDWKANKKPFPCEFSSVNMPDMPVVYDAGDYGGALTTEVKRLLSLPSEGWLPALQDAAHNRRHFLCPGGFEARVRLLARNVLRFAFSVADAEGSAERKGSAERRRARKASFQAQLAPPPPVPLSSTAMSAAAPDAATRHSVDGTSAPSAYPLVGAAPRCEFWCNVSCVDLHGNVEVECGTCSAAVPCHQGAEGFVSWRERWAKYVDATSSAARPRSMPGETLVEGSRGKRRGGGRAGAARQARRDPDKVDDALDMAATKQARMAERTAEERAQGSGAASATRMEGGVPEAAERAVESAPRKSRPSTGKGAAAMMRKALSGGEMLAQFAKERRAQALALDTMDSGVLPLAKLNDQFSVATAANAAPGTVPLCAHKARLPVIARFCRRTAERCAALDASLRRYVLAPPRAPPLIHREVGRQGAGFGAVLQEKANLLAFGIITGRPVLYYASRDAFNGGHTLLSAPTVEGARAPFGGEPRGPMPAPSGLPATMGFASSSECSRGLEQALSRAPPSQGRLPWRCDEGFAHGAELRSSAGGEATRWVPALDDGEAEKYLELPAVKAVWERWHHRTRGEPALGVLFPNTSAIVFNSPSVTNAFLGDFMRSLRGVHPELPPLTREEERTELLRGASEFSGPSCVLRHLTRRVAPRVLRTLLSALAPTASGGCLDGSEECTGAEGGAMLVALHLRRGDKAMKSECRDCINLDDPDVQEAAGDRVELRQFAKDLIVVNRTIARLRAHTGREAIVYVASDTVLGLRLAQRVLGPVLSLRGHAVHSTRTLHTATPDAIKVITDLLALALSDVLLAIGQSSFSGAAGALHGGLNRVGDHINIDGISDAEMDAVKAAFAR